MTIQTKPSTKEYREGWERIFGQRKNKHDIQSAPDNERDRAKDTTQCCPRDHNFDGNCDRHPAKPR